MGAAVLVILSGTLPVRAAYDHVEWPILVMLGALVCASALAGVALPWYAAALLTVLLGAGVLGLGAIARRRRG